MPATQTDTKGNVERTNGSANGAERNETKENGEEEALPWCYLFVHHAKVKHVSDMLGEKFRIFVHTTILYQRKDKQIKKSERPTISGLVFVQGDSRDIRNYLHEQWPGLHLVNDCSTRKIAVIPDSVMRPFMLLSRTSPTRIRFMPHTFDYYSAGNTLVRITSGPLTGLEGYRIRIARDKCLVSSIGGMTVAIGGIHKETFENLDQYAKLRKQQQESTQAARPELSAVQAGIDSCFFQPEDTLDAMAIAEALRPWLEKARQEMENKAFGNAAEILLFILEEAGSHLQAAYRKSPTRKFDEIIGACRNADGLLSALHGRTDLPAALKEHLDTQRESLAVRYPFLPGW